MATREYFPRNWTAALRQRTRWVTGIALQGWQQFGWSGKPGEIYWLWRDRKGLIGNPLSLLANLVFVYGLATALWTRATPTEDRLGVATLALQILRTVVRMTCVARVYGVLFSLGVPLRAVYANALNSAATLRALGLYTISRIRRRPLRWLKTDHAYPSRTALLADKRKLGEILVGSGVLSRSALAAALETRPPSLRLGEHLVHTGVVKQESIYQALSFQQSLPLASVEPSSVPVEIAHALPARVVRRLKVQPFRVEEGNLFLAGPEIPSAEMNRSLRSFTALQPRFHLVTPASFESLSKALL
jgi:adsorption protein B